MSPSIVQRNRKEKAQNAPRLAKTIKVTERTCIVYIHSKIIREWVAEQFCF